LITNYSNTHSSIQLPSIQLPSIQASFAELLSELERVNDDLLQAMKTNNREAFTNLIDRRSQISEQIQAVTNSSSLNNQKLVEMPDNLKIKLERILIQGIRSSKAQRQISKIKYGLSKTNYAEFKRKTLSY
jgi:uncharacterized protein YdcH (DUF465 family)